MAEKYDFSGYATRNDLRCSDGRTIRKDAFKDCDGKTVPLVWQHKHNEPANILGHALLENREDGVYTYGTFNDSEGGKNAKLLVEHGDITALSIYANQLKQKGGDVLHGAIREVSLVFAGANPGAFIDVPYFEHSDDEDSEFEAVIYTGRELELNHSEETETIEHASESEKGEEMAETEAKKSEKKEKTIQDVFDELTEEQKNVVYFLIGQAVDEKSKDDSKEESKETVKHADNGGNEMKYNVFEGENEKENNCLSHSEMETILSDGKRFGSLKDSFLAHAEEYGIENIEYLFPDARAMENAPSFIKRNDDWVNVVMNGTHHTPFSRVKSTFADITEADARARGYIKGNRKVEEVFGLLKRTTTPQTIYKKQKLDRDDVIDITDFDVVAWLKTEMRMMLNEEIARAVLVGDGRSSASDDKIDETHIRPIWTDDDLFTIKQSINLTGSATDDEKAKAFIKAVVKSRKNYKGSGNPVLFTTEDVLTALLLMEDSTGRIIYDSVEKLCNVMRVKAIHTVPVLEDLSRIDDNGNTKYLLGIVVNLNDYNIGADKGGAVNMFDDFDIDYNAQKYLIETRCSGALIKPYSAIVIEANYELSLSMEPHNPSDTVLGKTVSSLQSNIIVNDTFLTGTLKYVTGYTGYSGEVSEQSGYYVALKFEATEGATVKLQVLGGDHPDRIVTLDSDMDAVVRVSNKNIKLRVVATTDTDEIVKTYSFRTLKFEAAE